MALEKSDKMKVNYPIRYAAMPIIKQVGWSHGLNELEREYGVVAYIASKCYLVTERVTHKENGESIKDYEVVFPYQYRDFSIWQKKLPSFNLYTETCTNKSLVDNVFLNYEEAIDDVSKKNKELWMNNDCSFCGTLEEREERRKEFAEILARYKILERKIEECTQSLDDSLVKELVPVISCANGKLRNVRCNLYEFIRLFSSKKFRVYTLTKEEYESFISSGQLDNKNPKLLLINNPLDSRIKLVNGRSLDGHYIDKDKLSEKYYNDDWDVLGYSEDLSFSEEDLDKDALEVYTTENYDDIISTFHIYENINLSKEEELALKREKK